MKINFKKNQILKMSMGKDFCMALIKIAVALLSKSILFAISSLYNLTIGCAKNQILKKKDKNDIFMSE